MWQDLLSAFALMLVLEGILPFLNPGSFRKAMLMAAQSDDASLRFIGLTCMIIGVVVLYLVR